MTAIADAEAEIIYIMAREAGMPPNEGNFAERMKTVARQVQKIGEGVAIRQQEDVAEAGKSGDNLLEMRLEDLESQLDQEKEAHRNLEGLYVRQSALAGDKTAQADAMRRRVEELRGQLAPSQSVKDQIVSGLTRFEGAIPLKG